ncbi:hypothetical protein E3N88_31752 [Mikania micrantha]|uniref:Uncharacterized protein n=1 Tax=Mikania micrantha TaxID=192012 RepID=A0A5N6M791_9ASTR|nr:hypothetical protein E3N88_31752 [Mikania micrantha]
MDVEKLTKMAAGDVRTSGKGSVIRKKKAVYKTHDKSLNTKGTRNSSLGSAAQRKNEPAADDEDSDDDSDDEYWEPCHNHHLCIESNQEPRDDFLDDYLKAHGIDDIDAFPRKSSDIESLNLNLASSDAHDDDDSGPSVRLTPPPSTTRTF